MTSQHRPRLSTRSATVTATVPQPVEPETEVGDWNCGTYVTKREARKRVENGTEKAQGERDRNMCIKCALALIDDAERSSSNAHTYIWWRRMRSRSWLRIHITVAAAQYRSCSSCPARRLWPGAGRATSDSVGAPCTVCPSDWRTDWMVK